MSSLNVDRQSAMQIQYLEIVTKEMDAVCAAYASAHGVSTRCAVRRS
jgi:hypothetical protein